LSEKVSAAHTSIVQPEAVRVWRKLAAETPRFRDSSLDENNEFKHRLIAGEFAVSVETVMGSSNPVRMHAAVGRSDPYFHQSHNLDETYRDPESLDLFSSSNGDWTTRRGEELTDEEVVDWLVSTLEDWIETEGRNA
jgi:hypothetical protein